MDELQMPNDNFDPLAGIQKDILPKDPILQSGYNNAVGRPNPYATSSDPLATGITSTSGDPATLFKNQLQQKLDAASINASRSPRLASLFQYGGKDLSGQSFERYYALGDVKNKLGFNPYRDNESVYNANTSVFDDWTRMMTKSFFPLAKRGAIDSFMAIPDLLSSSNKPLGNIDQAREYEKATEMGYSSRGGILSSLSNIQMSFAYTVGIAMESLVETAAITAATSGLGTVPAALRTGSKIVSSVGDIYGALNKTRKALQNLSKNPMRAKTFWKAAGSDFVNFANPLRQTTEAFMDLRKSKNLTSLAKVSKTGGAFFRDVKELSVALSESNLEGGFVNNEVYKSLYAKELQKNNNQPLSDAKVKDIYTSAESAGQEAAWLNWPIIYLSNRMTIGNAFRGFRPIKEINKTFADNVVKRKGGYFVVNAAGKGKKPSIDFIKDTILPPLKVFTNPRTHLRSALRYSASNFMEGFQEVFQEAVSLGAKKYYIEAFNNPTATNALAHRAAYLHGAKEQLSSQGLETFLSGFLIGMHMKPINAGIEKAPIAYNYFFDKAEFENYKLARDKYGPELAKTLTEMIQDVDVMFDSRFFNTAAQDEFAKGMDNAQLRNDEWQQKNERDGARASGILTAIQTGTLDYYLENLETLEELDVKDIADSYGVTEEKAKSMKEQAPEFKKKVQAIQSRYNYVLENFEKPAEASTEGMIKDSPEYVLAKLREKAYHHTVFNAAFHGELFDAQLERKEALYKEAMDLHSEVNKGSNSLFQMMFNPETAYNEIALLESEIEILEASTKPQDKETLKKKKELLSMISGPVAFDVDNMMALGTFDIPENVSVINLIQMYKRYDGVFKVARQKLKNSDAYKNAKRGAKTKMTRNLKLKYEQKTQELRTRIHTKSKNVFTTLATQEGARLSNIEDEKLQKFLGKLIDYHTIESNLRSIQPFIDSFFDPAALSEQYNRNFLIMQDMYNKRKTYADNIVNNFLKNHEKNAALNYLAENFQIYISPEEFTNYVNAPNNRKPYINFVDTRRGVIVDSDSLEYQNYIEVLEIIRQLNNENSVPVEERGDIPELTEEEKGFANSSVSSVDSLIDDAFAFNADVTASRNKLSSNLECK
jgi:hypothetical protein